MKNRIMSNRDYDKILAPMYIISDCMGFVMIYLKQDKIKYAIVQNAMKVFEKNGLKNFWL